MSQLETTLRRAIADLDPTDRDGRRIALGNVRAAMVRLLAVYDPPLSAAAIETKIDQVDDLIHAIEAEFAPPAPRIAPPALPDPEPPAMPRLADSDFESEYEAGDEQFVDDAYDEGPFGDPSFDAAHGDDEAADEDDFPAGDDDADADAFEGDMAEGEDVAAEGEAALPRSGFASPRSLALVGGGLVVLLALLLGLLYLAGPKQFGAGASRTAAIGDPGTPAVSNPNAPAAAAGTDALEATDAEPRAEAAPDSPPPATTAAPPTAQPAEPAPQVAAQPTAAAPSTGTTDGESADQVAPPPGPAAAESLMLFDGHDPAAFKSSPDNPVQFEGGPNGGSVLIASSATSNGARLVVGPGVYQRMAGRTVRVVVVARGASGNPAASLRLAYQNGRQLSGWSDLALGDKYQSLAMTWTVPKQRTGAEGDAVLIEPGIPGDGTAAEIRSASIDILP